MMKLNPMQVRARQFITRTFLEKGFPPTSQEVSQHIHLDNDETETLLKSLSENKALVLHPHKSEVWLAHPFSASPNTFWVKSLSSNKGWWSNCSWCAMGIASLAQEDVQIISRWGGEDETFVTEVRNGNLTNSNFFVHMALPVSNLWDNVIYSCSLMLPFKSENAVDVWCDRHRINKGSVISADKCFELSSKWYGIYLDANWNRKSPDEVKNFFASIELDLNFKSVRK